ncbi:hypothetical protein ACLHDG_06735 [Sulfurovum sp. CS9]|uniref:hypothetical protein n=1 Tax=Sulfurovum sp. CS9 TaxID=3391146 RepID=UPI0039EAE4E2
MSLFGTNTLDEIAYQVWYDLHDRDDSKRKEGYSLDIRTTDELYIVCHALIVLIKSMDGKAENHPERTHPQLLKDIKSLRDRLYQHGFIDEAREHIARIHSAVKQGATVSAKKQAKAIADYVESELITVGTNTTRATKLRSFIKDAMIVISQNREPYKKDLDTLSKLFTF